LTLLTPDYRLQPDPSRTLGPFKGDLDQRFYGHILDFEARFPKGPPSLINCDSLQVTGDFTFGDKIRLVGNVKMINHTDHSVSIPDGKRIEGLWKV
jgi:UTP--glucose-1-phosphate uridylyltransferase